MAGGRRIRTVVTSGARGETDSETAGARGHTPMEVIEMNKAMGKLYATLYVFATAGVSKIKNNERGQGTLEYVGMIAVAAVIVVAVIGVLKGADLGNWVNGFIQQVKSSVGS